MIQGTQGPDSFVLQSWDITGSYIISENWEETLIVDSNWNTYIDAQHKQDEQYFDWISDISINYTWQGGWWWYDMRSELTEISDHCKTPNTDAMS